MDELQKLIDEYIKSGKTNEEIAQLITQHEDAKELDVNEVAGLIYERQKAAQISAGLSAKLAEDKAKIDAKTKVEAEKKRVDSLVDEKLKSINIDPLGLFKKQKTLRRFNPKTKLFEEVSTPSEDYHSFNNLLKAMSMKDVHSASKISHEIDIQNIKDFCDARGIKTTPTVSDVSGQGAYSIPTLVDEEIYQVLYAKSVMLSISNTENIVMEDKIYPTMYGISVVDIADQSTALTEGVATFTNPTVAMERAGAYSIISNTIISQKGADLVNAFVAAYTSAFALFLDLRLAVGNVTDAGDLVDGIVFDSNTNLPTDIALTALTASALKDIKNTLDSKVNLANAYWIANRKVSDAIGLLENTSGANYFPGYIEGRSPKPFGIPLVTNSQIGSALDVGGDARTGGTDDVLICADMTGIATGISPTTRIETSDHYLFTTDQMVIRGIKRYGQKVLSASGQNGIVAVAQGLTN